MFVVVLLVRLRMIVVFYTYENSFLYFRKGSFFGQTMYDICFIWLRKGIFRACQPIVLALAATVITVQLQPWFRIRDSEACDRKRDTKTVGSQRSYKICT